MFSLSLEKPTKKISSTRLSEAKRVLTVVVAIGMIVSLGCSQSETDRPHRYEATVVKTEYGIPHITAESWGSLGFGEAYTAAEDHICNMALALLQSRGESAAVFGPGPNNRNLSRDIVVKALGIPGKAREALAAQEPQIKEWVEGYTAGYNQFVNERAGKFGSWCDKATWVRAVTAAEFMAQYVTLVYTLPRIAGAITAATPPTPQAEVSASIAALRVVPPLGDTLTDMKLDDMGSNAWAIASKRSENGKGLLLANPHYPWYGIARFWEKHLTIPDVYDAYGAGLIGTPGVLIGFNETVGWTHTVSDSKRTVIYQLTLNPDNPRQYRWENDWRELSPVEVSANVKTADGLKNQRHTVWFSHHGPLIALPGLTDDPHTAFAVRDANASNLHTFAQWQAMGSAKNMDDFIDAHRNYNAMPWVNTIAASSDGRAVYIDNSNVGALSEEAILTWSNILKADPKLHYLYLSEGLVILDGSQQNNEWLETSSPVPHTEPFERRPLIESDQYVFNANDSYWLSDPEKPAAALSPLYGPTMTPRSIRTRMNIALLRPDSPYGHAGHDGKFSRGEIQTALFSNESLTADMFLPELLAACDAIPQRTIENVTVNLTKACNVLAAWDRRFNSESRGAVLFREWITQYPADETSIGSSLFQQPFNPLEAATTPAGLANTELALDRLARAILLLEAEGIGLDTALGNLQIGHRSERQYPVHGGNRHEGIANLQMSTTVGNNPTETPIFTGSNEFARGSNSLSKSGYNVVHGSSFIMTLGWNDAGPEAEGILSYSQSGDSESTHFDDQTQLYAEKTWRPIRFTPSDIENHAVSRKVLRSFD